jgi:hypothetical protein
MRKSSVISKLALTTVAISLLALPSAFADSRHPNRTNINRDPVNITGTIRDIDRERNRFEIELSNGVDVYAPANMTIEGRRGRDVSVRELDRGDVISVRGYRQGRGDVYATRIALVRDDDRRDRRDRDRYESDRRHSFEAYVVEVNRSRDVLTLRNDAGDTFKLDTDEIRGVDADNLERGDRVSVTVSYNNGRPRIERVTRLGDRNWRR